MLPTWTLAVASFVSLLYANPVKAGCEAQHIREYFYIGGEYVNTSTGYLFQNQMYVEKLSPSNISQAYPIVFFHGGGQTGTNFLNKPDGGRGWASWFLEEGYQVFIADLTTRGRSPWNPTSSFSQIAYTADYIEQRFTAVQNFNLYEQARLHTQWPDTGLRGDRVFDAYYASVIQSTANSAEQERATRDAGIALFDKIGPAILVTHSMGGLYGWTITDARPEKVKALIQIEPNGPPFVEAVFSFAFVHPWGLTSIPLTYSPAPTNLTTPLATMELPSTSANLSSCLIQAEPARRLINLAKVPILVETGEASYHAMYDHCTILFLKQAGVEVEHLELAKVGIHGNGHMQFLEKNSDDIAVELDKWIQKTLAS